MSTLAVDAIVDSSNGNTATINGATPTAYNTMGKNRIINGAMEIDQRNAGSAVTFNSSATNFVTDRWGGYEDTDGVMTGQQSSEAPSGFINSLKLTTTTADSSLGATQRIIFRQNIEGYTVADLGWGTADAKTITISFWVRSSLTGTHGGAISNQSQTRSYPFTYTINSADTWEQKSITVTGDTTGTWLTNNSQGIRLIFGMGVGSTYSGTAGSWAGTRYESATGAVSVIGTLNATWYITGVQLEVGSVATEFERRPYGTELALCQRYFEKSNQYGQAVGSSSYVLYVPSGSDNSSNATYHWKFAVTKRATPTMTAYTQSGTAGSWGYNRSGSVTTGTVTFHQPLDSGANLYVGIGVTYAVCHLYGVLTASAEL